jgi:hypothetical protein
VLAIFLKNIEKKSMKVMITISEITCAVDLNTHTHTA